MPAKTNGKTLNACHNSMNNKILPMLNKAIMRNRWKN
jgi:hypothetical protein